ncbi:MAG TPA: hypothetical protein VFC15_08615 [Candidatus Limnocylindrales bacterium]|jgi:hypothetical protein|nr:hypothetical protein [Candidatus Limnocylindrales bacterium]HZM10257.1 hypothetical protein [Candidatus Limnocylindrales bacterium]
MQKQRQQIPRIKPLDQLDAYSHLIDVLRKIGEQLEAINTQLEALNLGIKTLSNSRQT